MDIRLLVAKNIREIRSSLGLSQEELAHKCGLHRTYIGQVERAEKTIGIVNLDIIARELKTTVSNITRESS